MGYNAEEARDSAIRQMKESVSDLRQAAECNDWGDVYKIKLLKSAHQIELMIVELE